MSMYFCLTLVFRHTVKRMIMIYLKSQSCFISSSEKNWRAGEFSLKIPCESLIYTGRITEVVGNILSGSNIKAKIKAY